METQPDSVIALELNKTIAREDGTQSDALGEKIPNWKAAFMIFRSFVGIGVLTIPHNVQAFGINGSAVFFVVFTFMFLYVLDLVLRIAIDLGYTGGSIEELIEKSGNGKWSGVFSILNNWMLAAVGIVSCIFAGMAMSYSVMFFDWAACNFGWGDICGNKLWTHLIAFCFVIPLCLPHSMSVFSFTSMVAAVIILFTGALALRSESDYGVPILLCN